MLYHLFQYLQDFPGRGLMHYLSFRAMAALVISMVISFFAGGAIIKVLRRHQIGETVRDLGLQGQMEKKGTPALLAFSVVLVVKLVRIQVAFKPELRIEKALTPASARKELESARGNIYDCNGKMLATTVQRYNIYMDCTVRKKEFARNSQTRDSLEKAWMGKAYALSDRLAVEFPEHDAKWYYSEIRRGRANGEKFKRFGGLGWAPRSRPYATCLPCERLCD